MSEEAGRYGRDEAEAIVADATVDGRLTHRRTDPYTGEEYSCVDEVVVFAPEHIQELPFRAGTFPPRREGQGLASPAARQGAYVGKPGPSTEETPPPPSGAPAGSPLDDDLVWVAVRRRGIDAHRPLGSQFTACGRDMRAGERLLAVEARTGYSVRWCPRCWPEVA